MVSGQPVSVHEPASTRPGSAVADFGRSLAVPGTCRNVARRSRVTKNSVTSACAGGGEKFSQRGDELLAQLGHRQVHVLVGRRQRDRQVLAVVAARVHPGDPGPVEHPLHRGVHRRRERHVHDLAVVAHVEVDDRGRAQAGPAVHRLGRQRAGRDQPRGLLVRHREHHGVGEDLAPPRRRRRRRRASPSGQLGDVDHRPTAAGRTPWPRRTIELAALLLDGGDLRRQADGRAQLGQAAGRRRRRAARPGSARARRCRPRPRRPAGRSSPRRRPAPARRHRRGR